LDNPCTRRRSPITHKARRHCARLRPPPEHLGGAAPANGRYGSFPSDTDGLASRMTRCRHRSPAPPVPTRMRSSYQPTSSRALAEAPRSVSHPDPNELCDKIRAILAAPLPPERHPLETEDNPRIETAPYSLALSQGENPFAVSKLRSSRVSDERDAVRARASCIIRLLSLNGQAIGSLQRAEIAKGWLRRRAHVCGRQSTAPKRMWLVGSVAAATFARPVWDNDAWNRVRG